MVSFKQGIILSRAD